MIIWSNYHPIAATNSFDNQSFTVAILTVLTIMGILYLKTLQIYSRYNQ